ncbi:MAG: hypothetical protein WC763_03945 [Candidatus Paceibacterota bacterium]|jgi:hypothetical protein
MIDKKTKISLILGLVTLVILLGAAAERGMLSSQPSVTATSTVTVDLSDDAKIKAWLDENSGNKEYDSWTPAQQQAFKKKQTEILDALMKVK